MNPPPLKDGYTAEDLLRLNSDHTYELVDGKLLEKNMGAEAGVIAANLIALLRAHTRGQGLGWISTDDCGFQLFAGKPNRVRKPDVSFIRRGRLPDDRIPRGNVALHPDLAVEIVSPNDLAEDVEARINDYLQAGTPLLWVVYPNVRSVHIFRPDGTANRRREGEELIGEEVLPDFRCPVNEIFADV